LEGEKDCPDPELQRCDIIARQMETVTGKVGLTASMAKCFMNMTAQTKEHRLRYFCVAKGTWDKAQKITDQNVSKLHHSSMEGHQTKIQR